MISGDVFWAAADNTSLIYVNDAERVVMKGKSISYLITTISVHRPEYELTFQWTIHPLSLTTINDIHQNYIPSLCTI
jgi:hypothetical protein